MNDDEKISGFKLVSYIGILSIICLGSFLIAKYIIRSNVPQSQIPVDTSTRI